MVLRNCGANNIFDAFLQGIVEDEVNGELPKVESVVISNPPQMVVLKVVEYFFDARKPCPVRNVGEPHSIAYGSMTHPINYQVMENGDTVSVKYNSITLTGVTSTGCAVILNRNKSCLGTLYYFPVG